MGELHQPPFTQLWCSMVSVINAPTLEWLHSPKKLRHRPELMLSALKLEMELPALSSKTLRIKLMKPAPKLRPIHISPTPNSTLSVFLKEVSLPDTLLNSVTPPRQPTTFSPLVLQAWVSKPLLIASLASSATSLTTWSRTPFTSSSPRNMLDQLATSETQLICRAPWLTPSSCQCSTTRKTTHSTT